MFKKQKWKTSFIDINFSPRKRYVFPKYWDEISFSSKKFFLYTLSFITFLGIFFINYIANILIQKQQEIIENLDKELFKLDIEIKTLQFSLFKANNKFKTFYIPNLKEKIFIYWYSQWYHKKVIPAIKEFQNLTRDIIPYMGVWIYPNYNIIGKYPIKIKALPQGLIEYNKININPFNNPEKLRYVTIPNLSLSIKIPQIDPKFKTVVSHLRNETIKANLLLEYSLLKYPLEKFSYHSTSILIFPINIIYFPSIKNKFNNLKNYCNILIINQEVKKQIYLKNKWKTFKVLEGLCIKYVF